MLSLDEIKARLNIQDEDHNDLLVRLEADAVAFFSSETGRYFGPTEDVYEIYSGAPTSHIWLTDTPVGATVTMYYRGVGTLDWVLMPLTAYELYGRRVTFYPDMFFATGDLTSRSNVSTGWPEGVNNLRAAYTRGYEIDAQGVATGVPVDVTQAIVALVEILYIQRVTATPATNSYLGGGQSTIPAKLIPSTVRCVLDGWTTPALATNSIVIPVPTP